MCKLIFRMAKFLIGVSIAWLGLATLLPFSDSNEWWVRVWDFPRIQILALAVLFLCGLLARLLVVRKLSRSLATALVALLLIASIQTEKIIPYTALWTPEVRSAHAASADSCLKILISNVRMDNRESTTLQRVLRREQPDVALILENDQWWSDELAGIAATFPHVLDIPQDNTYGMLFMTRLEPDQLEQRNLVSATIPSVRARIRLKSGQSLTFYGIHPKPPRIGQDTDLRDRELMRVAAEIRGTDQPTVVSGDLNDVAWSSTTEEFKTVAQTLDPRVGRGIYATFHAGHWYLRWPLDHVFHTGQFEIASIKLHEPIGSDHFPLTFRLCAARTELAAQTSRAQ